MLQANEFIQHINPYSKQFIKQKKNEKQYHTHSLN